MVAVERDGELKFAAARSPETHSTTGAKCATCEKSTMLGMWGRMASCAGLVSRLLILSDTWRGGEPTPPTLPSGRRAVAGWEYAATAERAKLSSLKTLVFVRALHTG